jgi:hypothetical protein
VIEIMRTGFYSREHRHRTLKKGYIAQEPNSNKLQNRKNLRTAGFNLCNLDFKGKRGIRSTLCVKEGMQANKLFVNYRRLLSTKIHPNNLNERVLATKLKQIVEKYKTKENKTELDGFQNVGVSQMVPYINR